MLQTSALLAQSTASPDLNALKSRQQTGWASGDYAVIGTSLQIVGESLCEAVDIRAGQTVLDVAAGNGNATLSAARRWCDVLVGSEMSNGGSLNNMPALVSEKGCDLLAWFS